MKLTPQQIHHQRIKSLCHSINRLQTLKQQAEYDHLTGRISNKVYERNVAMYDAWLERERRKLKELTETDLLQSERG